MAYYASSDDENEAGSVGTDATNKPGSGVVSSQSGGASNAPTESPGAASHASAGGGASPFVGINEYLNANKPQSAKLGGTVGGYVGGKIDNAEQKLNTAGEGFGKAVEDNTVKVNQDLVNQIKSNPFALTQDQNKVSQVKNMSKGYAGPTDFKTSEQYTAAQPDINKALNTNQQLKDATGQTALLTNFQQDTRGGKVNHGAAILDQGLLQASPEAQAALAPTVQRGKDFESTGLTTAISNAMNKVGDAQKASADTNAYMKNLYDQQFAEQQQGLGQRATEANAQAEARKNSILSNAINSPDQLSDQDLSYLGVDRNTFNQLRSGISEAAGPTDGFNITGGQNPLSNFFKFGTANANAQNVASADDYARAAALRDLAGYGGDYLNNPALAGSYNQDLIDFDVNGAKNYIAEQAAKRPKDAKGNPGGLTSGANSGENALGGIFGGAPVIETNPTKWRK